jgi:hypothetical protein
VFCVCEEDALTAFDEIADSSIKQDDSVVTGTFAGGEKTTDILAVLHELTLSLGEEEDKEFLSFRPGCKPVAGGFNFSGGLSDVKADSIVSDVSKLLFRRSNKPKCAKDVVEVEWESSEGVLEFTGRDSCWGSK